MSKNKFKYIFGPVYSWRLGISVGIDPLSAEEKICNFDCVYCQLGKTLNRNFEREVFVATNEIVEELKEFPAQKVDYYTFSSRGEPTLALNLGEIIDKVKKIKKEKTAVITNSSLIYREDVQKDLLKTDFVLAKIDACNQKSLGAVNRTGENIKFNSIIEGIKKFKNIFKGKLALQIMFIEENKQYAEEIARIAREINPDQVQINTPLRPSAVKPLCKSDLEHICGYFKGMPAISVYEFERQEIKPVSDEETALRHGQGAENTDLT